MRIRLVAGAGALALLSACTSAHTYADSAVTSAQATPSRPASSPAADTASTSAPATAAASKTSVTISAAGDTMLGNTPDLPSSPGTYLDMVKRDLTHNAQIVFGNLEGTLTTATTSKCGTVKPSDKKKAKTCFAFRLPPSYARYLHRAGFTVLNDANNHSFDFGSAGQAQTVRSIHAAGMAQTGLPGEITTVKANGVRVAFVAFAPYDYTASLLDVPAARALIMKAARQASIVVVYMHTGAEGASADHVTGHEEIYLGEDRGNPEAFAHMAIDAGASLVIASGPHVVRGLQFYKKHLIAYSLGDFASYGDFSLDGDLDTSAILHVTLSSTGAFERARLYPVTLTGEGEPVPGGGAVPFMAKLGKEDFGASAARVSKSGVITRP